MFRFPPLTPTVKKLLIGLFGLYILEVVLERWAGIPLTNFLALRPDSLVATPWTLVTHVLVSPPDPLWLILGLIFVWWFLAPVEERFGSVRLLQLCGASVLGAGLAGGFFGWLFGLPGVLAGPGTLSFAGLSAYFWAIRGRQISLFGVATMRAEQAIWLFLGLAVLSFLFSKNFVALLGDLAAAGVGIGFVEWMRKPPKKAIFRKKPAPKRRKKGAPLRVVRDDEDDDDDAPKRWLN